MSEELVPIGATKYPRWAVDEAKKVIEKHGGKLESTVQAVLMLAEADKHAVRSDPNAPGKGLSHAIGGYVVPKPSNSSKRGGHE